MTERSATRVERLKLRRISLYVVLNIMLRFASGLLTFGLATWKELDICGQAIKGIWGMSWH